MTRPSPSSLLLGFAALCFAAHQWTERVAGWPWPWADAYLDDLLWPCLMLPLLRAERRLMGLPAHLGWGPILAFAALSSSIFEWLLPQWDAAYVADPYDILAYGAGCGLFAGVQALGKKGRIRRGSGQLDKKAAASAGAATPG